MTLPWLRVDRNISRHPKADLLDAALGERRTWSYVVELWMWAAEMRPSGELAGIPDTILARRAGYEGDAARFVAALVECGWLTTDRTLHDWHEYQGARAEKADRDVTRRREARSPDRSLTARSTSGSSAGTAGNGTRRYETERNSDRECVPATDVVCPPTVAAETPHTPPENRIPIREGPIRLPFTPRAKTVHGLVEEEARPKTIDELIAHPHAKLFNKRFPKLSANRSAMRDAIAARFEPFTRKHVEQGSESAWGGLREWLEDAEAKQARKARFAEPGADGEAPDERKRKLITWWRAHAHEDLPPFHVWIQRAESDGTVARILGEPDTSVRLASITQGARAPKGNL